MENELCQQKMTVNQSKISEELIENVLNDSTNDIKNEFDDKTLNDTTKVSGIYKIVNKVNGKYYVGSTNNFRTRLKAHFRKLENKKHHSWKLQKEWCEYGKRCFYFSILEIVPIVELQCREQCYLNVCKTDETNNYNISFDSSAPWRGKTLSVEHRLNLRKSLEGKPLKEEHKLKLKGRIFTEEHRDKLKKKQTGRKLSEETKEKVRRYQIYKHSKLRSLYYEI